MIRLLRLLSALVLSVFAASLHAQDQVLAPQRCYFNGTYDTGFMSSTVLEIIRDQILHRSLGKYVVYQYVTVADLPPAYLAPGSELEALLKSKVIRIAHLLPARGASFELIFLDKDSFSFTKEISQPQSYALVMFAFGDGRPVLEQLLKDTRSDFLLSEIVGPIANEDTFCN
jgi:hypothetical protein